MGVRSSVSDAIEALKRNPVLFVAAFLVAVVNLLLLGVAMSVRPESGGLYWSAASLAIPLISLFFVGGAYAMAAEGVRGETRLGTLVSEGRDNYVSLVGATLLLYAVGFAVSVALSIAAFVAIFAISGTLGAGALGGAILVMVFGSYLLAAVPFFFFQFYAPAVVVSDDGVIASLKRSFGLVRHNLLATLGFDALLVAIMVVATAPTGWLYARWWNSVTGTPGSPGFGTPEMVPFFTGLDPATLAAYFVSSLVVGTLSGAFFYPYHVAFYEDLLDALGNTDAVSD